MTAAPTAGAGLASMLTRLRTDPMRFSPDQTLNAALLFAYWQSAR
jgi:hypothetical protein